MNKNHCYGCKERHRYCHSKCPRYIRWKTEHDTLKEKERKFKERVR